MLDGLWHRILFSLGLAVVYMVCYLHFSREMDEVLQAFEAGLSLQKGGSHV